MGELIAFPGVLLPDPGLEVPSFSELIDSTETINRVASSIAELMHFSEYDFIPPYTIIALDKPSNFGAVGLMDLGRLGPAGVRGIVTTDGFPTGLVKNGLDHEQAVEIAADYVHAFGLFIKGVSQAKRVSETYTRSFASSQKEELWPAKFVDQSAIQSLPFRAAARIALHGQKLETVKFSDSELPAHIASLQNPLDDWEIRKLHDIAKKAVA